MNTSTSTMILETHLALLALAIPLVCVYAIIGHFKRRKYAKIPMATPRLPLFGNALSLDMSRCHMVLAEWAQKFGPVYRINIMGEEILCINDFDSIHDALVAKDSAFAGRPPMYRTSKNDRHKHSIVWQTYTEKLQYLRKEVLRSLKIYGNGMDNLEQKCLPELRTMVEAMASHMGKDFNPREPIFNAVSNIMFSMTLGKTYDPHSSEFRMLREISDLFNDVFSTGNARNMDFLPWISKIRYHDHAERLVKSLELRDEMWDSELQFLKDREDLDCIVRNVLSLANEPKGQHLGVCELTAKEVFTNVILAGTDTTTTSLTCLLMVFLHQPEVQDKMWAELMKVVGDSRLATLSDRANMPYFQAVILELLRYICHVPLAVPHYTTRDTDVIGIPIPKDMTVYINLWSMHHDPATWSDPWTFRPERFLDQDGQLLPTSHPIRRQMMVFGAGRRVCLGEALAKNRLFLFSATLVRHFHFLPSEEDIAHQSLPSLDPRSYEMGLVLRPKPFTLRAKPRM